MVDYIKCKSCETRVESPMQVSAGLLNGPPGGMVIACPNCGKNIDLLYDKD